RRRGPIVLEDEKIDRSKAYPIADAIKRIRARGKAPGILVGEADGKRMLDLGALFVAVGADAGVLRMGAEALAHKFKS
ncbi:MAG: hypothetical protein ACMG6H_14315, partial [Acidobacteriota bacterium]